MAHLLKTTTMLAIHIRKKKKKSNCRSGFIHVLSIIFPPFIETVTSSNTGTLYNKVVNYSS